MKTSPNYQCTDDGRARAHMAETCGAHPSEGAMDTTALYDTPCHSRTDAQCTFNYDVNCARGRDTTTALTCTTADVETVVEIKRLFFACTFLVRARVRVTGAKHISQRVDTWPVGVTHTAHNEVD